MTILVVPYCKGMNTTQRVAELRAEGFTCDHPLAHGRTCVHITRHADRHSRTWQPGDASHVTFADGRTVDMETGELAGYFPPVDAVGIRKDMAPVSPRAATGPKPLDPWHHNGSSPYWCPHVAGDMWTCKACNYGYETPEGGAPKVKAATTIPAENVTWHYHAASKRFGATPEGWDVEQSSSGKVARIYSPKARGEAVEFARRFTPRAASLKFDIPVKTIQAWMGRG